MSQENVEVVRQLFSAFNRRDSDAVCNLWTADAEWHPAYIGGGLLEGATFRGHQGQIEFVELQSETWETLAAEPVEVRDLGEHVLAEVCLQAVGRASGTPVERVTWNVYEFRDGKVATGRVYETEDEALRAIGREE